VIPAGEAANLADVADDRAAMTGPTPKISVRLVPAAWTAVVSFFLVWCIAASMPRRSSVNAAASSQRAAATAPDGVIDSRR
jgi:hypothetical protein